MMFRLELKLFNVDLHFLQAGKRFTSLPTALHEAVDFILGLGQTIPHLSASAKNILRGQIVGGLKTKGLRPLQHEFRVATTLSNQGYDISFADLEGIATFDFLASKSGDEFEVEVKSIPIFSGRPIDPYKAERLLYELQKWFNGWADSHNIPIIEIIFQSGLPTSRPHLFTILEECNYSARFRSDRSVHPDIDVRFTGTIRESPLDVLKTIVQHDWKQHGVMSIVLKGPPKAIIKLRSGKKDKFRRNVTTVISEASRSQLSRIRPAAIWVNLDFITVDSFKALSDAIEGSSQLDIIANTIFDSQERSHIVQLVFSGGIGLLRQGDNVRSNFASKAYNNPNTKYQV